MKPCIDLRLGGLFLCLMLLTFDGARDAHRASAIEQRSSKYNQFMKQKTHGICLQFRVYELPFANEYGICKWGDVSHVTCLVGYCNCCRLCFVSFLFDVFLSFCFVLFYFFHETKQIVSSCRGFVTDLRHSVTDSAQRNGRAFFIFFFPEISESGRRFESRGAWLQRPRLPPHWES